MELVYRVLIGMCAGLDNVFPSAAQDLVDTIGKFVGREIGKEMLERGVVNENMSISEIIRKLEGEGFAFGDAVEVSESEDKVEIKIRECNVCPKKVGGYPIRKTACPVGGIVLGLLESIKKESLAVIPELIPGTVCIITIKK